MNKAGFEGRVEMVQRCGLFNHLHWLMTNGPQPDVQAATSIPQPISQTANASDEFREDLAAMLDRADAEYRGVLKRHGLAESIAFVGGRRPDA